MLSKLEIRKEAMRQAGKEYVSKEEVKKGAILPEGQLSWKETVEAKVLEITAQQEAK